MTEDYINEIISVYAVAPDYALAKYGYVKVLLAHQQYLNQHYEKIIITSGTKFVI